MGELTNFKGITNWEELFILTYDFLIFLLLQDEKITPELMIKCTHGLLNNAGFEHTIGEVTKKYYACY